MKKKILIIGGAGFIGHNLALNLTKQFKVFIVDSLNTNNLYNIKKNKFYPNPKLSEKIVKERFELLRKAGLKIKIINAINLKKLKSYFSEIKPNVVVHLAAVSHASKSNEEPGKAFDDNLITLKNSLICSVKNSVEHFIFLSSSMIYGNFKKGFVNENFKCNPIGIYGNLKLSAEYLIKSFNQVFKLNYTIIRPSALYGDRCISRRVGQVFIENALTGKPLKISGSLKEKLDFTHIDDLINGIKLSIKNKKSRNQTFNITYGKAKTLEKMIKILKEYFSYLKIIQNKRDKLVPVRGTLSIAKAKKLIGFKSRISFEIGFRRYIKWYKNFYKRKIINEH